MRQNQWITVTAVTLLATLPASTLVAARPESSAFEGTYWFAHFDGPDDRHEHLLVTADGRSMRIDLADDGPLFAPGSLVRVHGKASEASLRPDGPAANSLEVLQAPRKGGGGGSGSGGGTTTPAPEPGPIPVTVRKTAVFLINFQNDASQPYSAGFARSVVFTDPGSANAFYQENSKGLLSLGGLEDATGDVFGWYTIPYGYQNCYTTYTSWAKAAKDAAVAQGHSLAGYDQFVYAFKAQGCPYSGWSFVGGSEAWINSLTPFTAAHEIGHSLGAYHANTYSCTTNSGQRVSISASCTSKEYGDPYDVMGATFRHFNAYHKGQLRLLAANSTMTVTAEGTYTLAPIEFATNGLQSLRVARESVQGAVTSYYYMDYRQSFGFDQFVSTDPATRGVSVRLAPPYGSGAASQLLDMTPATTTFNDASLGVGARFFDAATGVAITTLEAAPDHATVQVQFGQRS